MLSRKSAKKDKGAWQRANQWIHDHPEYAAKIKDDEDMKGSFNDLWEAIGRNAGYETGDAYTAALVDQDSANPSSPDELLAQYMTTGFPWSVWNGKPTDPNYVRVEAGGTTDSGDYELHNTGATPKYFPIAAARFRNAAYDIRQRYLQLRKAFNNEVDFANRQISRKENPGGVANAVNEPAGATGAAGNFGP